MDSSTILITLVAVLGFVLTVAGAVGSVAVFKISRNTATVQNYKENAASWKEKSERQDDELEDLRRQMKAQQVAATAALAERDEKIADLMGQVHTLQEVVSGRAAIHELGQQLTHELSVLNTKVETMATEIRTYHGQVLTLKESQ